METPSTPDRRPSWRVKALAAIAILALVIGGLWWWHHRPIQPVQLSALEKSAVEAKIEAIQKPAEPKYEKGAKEITLTERELNGLLNENTDFGKSISFELVTNAIHARVESDLDPDLPLIGGKRLKARARFLVGDEPGHPSFILDDLTLWGISLPNDWLAGLKNRNLLDEVLGGGKQGKIAGIEEFKVERGRLILRLAE